MKHLNKFIRRRITDYLLFSWVSCMKYMLPSVTTEQAIEAFYKFYRVEEKDYPKNTAISTFQRMNKEWNDTEDAGT